MNFSPFEWIILIAAVIVIIAGLLYIFGRRP